MHDWHKLEELSKLRNSEEIQEFEKMVGEFIKDKDPEVLERLLDFFDDECEYPEIMYSLIHAIESYEDEIYVKKYIKKISSLFKVSPHWCKLLLYRIINNEKCLHLFIIYFHLAQKLILYKIFDLMEKESEEHKFLIQKLRTEREKFPD